MKQYIDKSVIVAEIENRKRKLLDHIISESDKVGQRINSIELSGLSTLLK